MTSQNNIEQLKTTVREVTAEVTEVKNLEDEILKKTKAEAAALKTETLLKQITTTKNSVNKKLELLKGKTDAQSLEEISVLEKEIAQLEEMLQTLESSQTDLTELKKGITVENTKTGVQNTPEENDNEKLLLLTQEYKDQVMQENTNKKTEKKSSDKKGWFKRQIDGFSDPTEENHTWKNVGRIAGGIGIGILAWKGIKRLFGIGKNKEESNEKESKTEKKSRWKKALIGLGIGTGGYYLVHGLVTGRWGLSDVFNRDKKEKINPDDLNDRYTKNVPETLKPKYDKFAGNVEDYRKTMGNTGKLSELEDKEGGNVEVKRGAIPAVMDNAYDNVGDILDTSGDIYDRRGRSGQKLWGLVQDVGGKVVGGLLKGGVGLIKGLTASMFGKNGEPNDEFKVWAEKTDITRDEQVANLFQKYSMVRTYLNDKRKQLTRKYTIEQLKLEGISNPNEEQIEDYETNKDIVEMRVERDFLQKKIVSEKDGESAVTTLETQGIYDSAISVENKALLDEVKAIRKEIIPDETIWDRSKNASDINKDENLRKELSGVSTKFAGHLKEGILQRNILAGIANARGILNLDELWNSKADDLEEAMEQLGFGDEVKRFALQNNDFYNKLQNKTLTKTDIATFEKTINDYFSLLQQVMLETQTQQENEGWFEWKTWFMGRLYTLVNSGGTYVIVGGALLNSGIKNIFKLEKTPVKYALDFTLPKAKWIFREPMRRINVPKILGNKYLKRWTYGESTAQCDKFINDFKKGRITYDEAKDVFSNHVAKYDTWKARSGIADGTFNGLLQKEYNLTVEQIQIMDRNFNNKNILNLLKDEKNTLTDVIKKLKAYEDTLDIITDIDQANTIRRLFEVSKFTKLSDIDNIVKNIDKFDYTTLASLSDKELKAVGKNISELTTVDKFNTKITEIKKTVSTVNNVTEVLDQVKVTQFHDIIDTQIEILTKKIAPNTPKVRVTYYQDTIESLKALKGNTHMLTTGELDSLLRLGTNGFDVSNLAKLYKMSKVNVRGVGLIEEALQKGDVADIIKALEVARETPEYTKIVLKGDIDEVVTTLKKIDPKVIAECGSDIANVCKSAIKLFTKMT